MWKSIKEWEGLYSINENGDIKNDKTGKLIVGDKNNCGYCRVCLYDKQNNRKQRYFRHRLVAIHFLDNPNLHGKSKGYLNYGIISINYI